MIIESTKENLPPTNGRSTWVLIVNEYVDWLSAEWSDPVRVRIETRDNGDRVLAFRNEP